MLKLKNITLDDLKDENIHDACLMVKIPTKRNEFTIWCVNIIISKKFSRFYFPLLQCSE